LHFHADVSWRFAAIVSSRTLEARGTMGTEYHPDARGFLRDEVCTERRLLLRTTCRFCGRSISVLYDDGTVEAWEQAHTCAMRIPSGKRRLKAA
jgi:hypothetical protein